ncbi:MAG: AIM24 family protein [Candidatus Xenobiia bacterium LiM19]
MPSYSLANEKLLQVVVQNDEVYSKRGAMIAYKGDFSFARTHLIGGTIQQAAMRAVTNEGLQLMSATGTGEIYYAHLGQFVTIITLNNETMYVESDSVIAFDKRLRPDTMFLGNQGIQGLIRGATAGQGLFTTTLTGRGEVAIISDGNAIALDVTSDRTVFVDPNAYIGHKGQLTSTTVLDVGWKNLIGQGSGESFQLKFTGTGTVYIQASER